MLTFQVTETIARKIRAMAKSRKISVSRFLKEATEHAMARETVSFGAAARKFAGIVHSGIGDLSMREGFDD